MAIVEVHGKRGRGLDLMLVDDVYIIGTRDVCDLVIEDDDTVSRVHARIECHKRAAWSVIDAGSRNGTLVNGKPVVGEHGLRHGDEIILGRYTKLVFRDAKSADVKTTNVLEPPPRLTPRERDVLVELVRPLSEGGLFQQPSSVKDIAAALFVGEGAVKNQLANLYVKFDIHCEKSSDKRPELARASWQRGSIGPDDFKKPPEQRMEVFASRYEVIETIREVQGRALLRALDRQLQLPVALKIVEPTAERSRDDVLAETGVLRGVVSHAGIPKVFDDFFDGERYVIVMEWVDGVDLEQELLARGEPGLTLSTVVEYAGQAAAALDHLHRNDPPVVHGDVKPANLVRRKDGKIVLVDFGIARAAGTRSHEGTKGYVAPEVMAGAVASSAQDVFSLAMTVLTLLTGRAPEESDSDLDAYVERDAIGRLALTLQLGLHMDPARRPTAAEFAERLRVDASSLPTGEVTFVAAELVGASDLWERDSDAMEVASQRLDGILALAVDDWRGRVVATDPFRAVFTHAAAASAAALAIRQRVRVARWPSGLDVELRIAVHTGEAMVRYGNYVGASYAYVTRVLSNAVPDSVLLSRTTAELTRNRLPEGARTAAMTARDGTELFLLLGPGDEEPERETAPMPRSPTVSASPQPVAATDPAAIRRALVDRRFDALLEQQAMVTALKDTEALPAGPERSLEIERQRQRVIAASDLLDQAKAALAAHDASNSKT